MIYMVCAIAGTGEEATLQSLFWPLRKEPRYLNKGNM
jgi:hypothetical protein